MLRLINWTGWTKEDWIKFIKNLGEFILACVLLFGWIFTWSLLA